MGQTEKLRDDVERIVDDIIDAVAEKRECDLVEDIAAVLPTRITLELIGVPREDWD